LSGVRATLLWVPISVPPRLALLEERWFPSAIAPEDRFVVSQAALGKMGVSATKDLDVPVTLHTLNHHPPHALSDGGWGARLGGTWRDADWDVYHYTGPETGPDVDLRSTARLVPTARHPITSRAVLRQ